MRLQLSARFLIATLLLALLLTPIAVYAATNTSNPWPTAIYTQKGGTGGQAVQNLRVKNQSGTQDDPSKYVTFTTPGIIYQGYLKFSLPLTINRSAVTNLTVKLNYKGPLKSQQAWSWSLYDWTSSAWIKVGDNAPVTGSAWTYVTFNAADPRRFINTSTREIRLQIRSGNSNGDARMDYAALQIGFTAARAPTLAGCPVFPANNFWNVPVDSLPVHPMSAQWVSHIGPNSYFHTDFGSGTWDGGPIGIPYNVVPGMQPKVNVTFEYADESDPGPYPIPASPLREWGSDHHILIVDRDHCVLYELYDARKSGGQWYAGSGAIWRLGSNALRPANWTSADLAGTAMLPGLVRYEEVAAGQINHAIRFTAWDHAEGYIWPARHPLPNLQSQYKTLERAPMGARFRLKASYVIPASAPPEVKIILQAMKKYGLVLADTGSEWYIGGVPDERWDNDHLHWFDEHLQGKYFEAVDTALLRISANSGQAQP